MPDNPTTRDVLSDLRQMSGMDHVGQTAIRAAAEIDHLHAKVAQLKHALSEVKLAIEMTATDVVWTRQACPETACDFIARMLEEINDVAF